MSTSQALLEEKYRRAMAFGKYLAAHPDQDPLIQELQSQLTRYRIALHNVMQDRLPKEKRKGKASG